MYVSLNSDTNVFTNPDTTKYSIAWFCAWIMMYERRNQVPPSYLDEPPHFTETDNDKYYKVETAFTDNDGNKFYICTVGEPATSGNLQYYRYIILDRNNVTEHAGTAQQEVSAEHLQEQLDRAKELANRPTFMEGLKDIFGDLVYIALIVAGIIVVKNLGAIKAALPKQGA